MPEPELEGRGPQLLNNLTPPVCPLWSRGQAEKLFRPKVIDDTQVRLRFDMMKLVDNNDVEVARLEVLDPFESGGMDRCEGMTPIGCLLVAHLHFSESGIS